MIVEMEEVVCAFCGGQIFEDHVNHCLYHHVPECDGFKALCNFLGGKEIGITALELVDEKEIN